MRRRRRRRRCNLDRFIVNDIDFSLKRQPLLSPCNIAFYPTIRNDESYGEALFE